MLQAAAPVTDQLALFGNAPHPVVDALKSIDPDAITPREALALLAKLVEQAKQSAQ